VFDAGAIILAGGRSSRMGSPKAALDWHGSTLLRRITGLAQRAVGGPVVVVSAPGQELPAVHPSIEVVDDAREGRGPLQGLAAGLAAVGDRAEVAFVCSTDVPLLHPAFIRCVLDAFTPEVDVVLPEIHGFRQPLSAGYRTSLLPEVQARARPAPEIEVRLGTPAADAAARSHRVAAWTLGQLADAVGVSPDERVTAALNGHSVARDRELPLAVGDEVVFGTRATVA
jgi:molybdenum cofactor guanylyltransferase